MDAATAAIYGMSAQGSTAEFIVKGVETKPPYKLMLVTSGNADTLSDLVNLPRL